MNKKIAISLIGGMFISSAAFADVVIKVPDTVTILLANGQKAHVSGGMFSDRELHLPDGQEQIVFRFEPYFQSGQDNVSVESHVTIAKFKARNQTLSLNMPSYPNLQEARNNIKTMQWSMNNSQGHAIKVTQDTLIKEGIQYGRNYYTEMSVYNQANKVASVPEFVPGYHATTAPQISAATQVSKSATGAASPTAEAMLHYWYDLADEQTKLKFKKYIANH